MTILLVTIKIAIKHLLLGLNGIDCNMSQEEILDIYFKQTLQKEAENINEAIMHYNPRDEAETCKNLRPDGTCYKGKKCQFRHVPLTCKDN